MKNRINLVAFALFILATTVFGQGTSQAHYDYILKYKDIAISEMKRSSIPASITLAQGILESEAGKSLLATKANNHFGIKAWKNDDWFGETYAKKDDDYDADGNLTYSHFRVYQTADESYVAHSDFLKNPKKSRYDFLFDLDISDYKAWARGLQSAHYAGENKTYADKLISLIERYKLDQYDKIVSPATETEPTVETAEVLAENEILHINELPYVLAKAGQKVGDIAVLNAISPRRLVKYNDDIQNPNQILDASQIVFLQSKKWNNAIVGNTFHSVQKGETMIQISQTYGIGIFWLNFKNRMKEGMEPAVGSQIKLNGSRVKIQPKLASTEQAPNTLPVEKEEEVIEPPVVISPHVEKPPSRSTQPIEERAITPTYIVKKGDTLWRISKNNNLAVDEIKKINGLSGNTLSIGQKLRLGY